MASVDNIVLNLHIIRQPKIKNKNYCVEGGVWTIFFFKQNHCHACRTWFAVFFPLPRPIA